MSKRIMCSQCRFLEEYVDDDDEESYFVEFICNNIESDFFDQERSNLNRCWCRFGQEDTK